MCQGLPGLTLAVRMRCSGINFSLLQIDQQLTLSFFTDPPVHHVRIDSMAQRNAQGSR
jgi:hypothetical protein